MCPTCTESDAFGRKDGNEPDFGIRRVLRGLGTCRPGYQDDTLLLRDAYHVVQLHPLPDPKAARVSPAKESLAPR